MKDYYKLVEEVKGLFNTSKEGFENYMKLWRLKKKHENGEKERDLLVFADSNVMDDCMKNILKEINVLYITRDNPIGKEIITEGREIVCTTMKKIDKSETLDGWRFDNIGIIESEQAGKELEKVIRNIDKLNKATPTLESAIKCMKWLAERWTDEKDTTGLDYNAKCFKVVLKELDNRIPKEKILELARELEKEQDESDEFLSNQGFDLGTRNYIPIREDVAGKLRKIIK